MSNPGPSSSSNTVTTAVVGNLDGGSTPTFYFGGPPNVITPLSLSKAFGTIYGLSSTAVPTGIAPSGSVGANGALTLGTSLISTYGPTGVSAGIWLYFPQGAVYGGSLAGSYWCVMTSGTAGTVFNNLYVAPGSNIPPVIPTSIVDPGPGNYTGVTSEVVVFGALVAGNSMGVDGVLESFHLISANNNANTKTGRVRFGAGIGGTIYETLPLTSTRTQTSLTHVLNRHSTQFQVSSPAIGFGASAAAPITSNIDTTVDQQFVTTLQMATATDFMICEIADLDIDAS